MTIYRGPGGTGSATSDADTTLYQDFLNQTEAAKDAAHASQTAAAGSATSASTSATNAANSATAAGTSATNAANSATAASTSATNAASSASAASTSASSASTSASAASTSATNAASSATSSASSASSASTSATNAVNSATSASNSASTATTQASNAASSATAASASATSAASSATTATTQATNASNSATAAATSATNAANSASSASGSAAAAAASAASINPSDIVHISGTETITGAKTFSQTITCSITGNAGTTTNGVVTTGSYADPTWITSLAGSKVSGNISGNAANVTGTVAITNGGTGSTTASAARTALGVAIGSDVQAYSPNLATYASTGIGFRNRIINGAMVIDQRYAGASVTVLGTGNYTVDRYTCLSAQSSKYSIQQNAGAVTPPAGFTKYLGVTSLSAYSVLSTDFFGIDQRIEGFNIADLGWGTANAQAVTLSFRVYSSLSGTFGGCVNNLTNRSYPFTYSVPSANTWTTINITIPGDTTGTWATDNTAGLRVVWNLGAGASVVGTAGSWQAGNFVSASGTVSVVGTNAATFYITGVQLERGSVATPFEVRQYGTELALCQRYYNTGAFYVTINTAPVQTFYPVEMRASPTISGGGTGFSNTTTGTPTKRLICSQTTPADQTLTFSAEL